MTKRKNSRQVGPSPARQTTRPAAVTAPAPVSRPVVPEDPEETFEDLAYQAAHQARLTQTRYSLLERRCVLLGRQGGVSWDRLGGWLDLPGETLRRRYRDLGL